MEIVFASNNENKTREIRNILGNVIRLVSLGDLNITDEIPEEEPELEGNAIFKARYVYNLLHRPVFADDTGLEVEALGGEPGVKSARYAGESKSSDANIEKLLSRLADTDDRRARFRTVIALVIDENEFLFEGVVRGEIIRERRGREGFGYDPVFIPEGYNTTFAEMPLDEKNKISHRARAFEKLKEFLYGYHSEDNKGAY
jgi:XTP/dITP diphosphohydrolase